MRQARATATVRNPSIETTVARTARTLKDAPETGEIEQANPGEYSHLRDAKALLRPIGGDNVRGLALPSHIHLCPTLMFKMTRKLTAGACAALGLGLLAFTLAPSQVPGAAALSGEMVAAAETFLALLDDAGREKASMPLDSEERVNWNFVPLARQGLPLKEMTLEQRVAAHALLRSVLSSSGYLKATSIMQLEEVLFVLENNAAHRDREMYYVSVFGTPSMDEPWGWRFEGHHLSLNYTSVGDELTAVTPAFLGSNPAEIRSGPMTGLRVLAAEEDLARDLMIALDPQQRTRALIMEDAPRDILTSNARRVELGEPEGLPASAMNDEQRAILLRIIDEYAYNLRPELADAHLDRIRAAGVERLHFAWAGSLEPGERHYYRVHGPNVLFEYDNTQNNANHVHSVWRDLDNDFGDDMLRRHYLQHPHE